MAAHLPRTMIATTFRPPNLFKMNKLVRLHSHSSCTPRAFATLPRPLIPNTIVSSTTPPVPSHTSLLLNDSTTSTHRGTLQCLRPPSIQEELDPFALLLPTWNTTTTNNSDSFRKHNKLVSDSNDSSVLNKDPWIEIIEPALRILEISEPASDPGAVISTPPLGNNPALEMAKRPGYQHPGRLRQSRMNKHKLIKKRKRDRIINAEVKEIRFLKKQKRRARLKEELVEKLEKMKLKNPGYAEAYMRKTYVKWKLEYW